MGEPKATEGRIAVPGGQVWFQITGADQPGIPLLCLHGGPGMPHDYLEPLAGLALTRPVIFYDQLGCGRSDRPAEEALWTVGRGCREVDVITTSLCRSRPTSPAIQCQDYALPLAGGSAGVGIIATVFMVATRRTCWLDKAARVFDEQAAARAAEQSQTEA